MAEWMKHRLMAPDGEGDAGGGDAGSEVIVSKDDGAAAAAARAAADNKPGYWPGDWREKAAEAVDKTNAGKIVERLSRYATPAEVAKALIAAQTKISSGELKPTLGKNASAEEVAAWREAHGIPPDPKGYKVDLGNGMVVAEQDAPILEHFLKEAHRTNQTPEQVNASIKAYYEANEAINTARAEADRAAQAEGEEALRAEWGTEFRRNVNLAVQLLDMHGDPDIKDALMHGRLADGTPIFSSPAALKFFLNVAMQLNPAGALVPSGAGPQGIDDEIAKIEKTMRTNRNAYNKDEKMQERYRTLLAARENLNQRKAA